MRFEERELKGYAEPVPPSRLVQGAAYFSVTYVDDQMLMPRVEPLIFAGENLDLGDVGRVVYFQDVVSYRQGIRRDSPAEDGEATFFATPEGELKHMFEYEGALDELLRCALRRRKKAMDGLGRVAPI
jgi:hypothetical protein